MLLVMVFVLILCGHRYHVPRSFLKDSGNVLVLFEEEGGNPLDISLNTVSTTNSEDNLSK